MNTYLRPFGLAAALSVLMMPDVAALAQAARGTPDYSTIEVRGRGDPRLRKAAAIINGAVVTDLDVDQRLNLALAASGTKLPPEEQLRLRSQVLRNLIDEKIQIAEAKEHDVVITDDQVNEFFARVAQNFKQDVNEFDTFLRSNGSSAQSLKDQIRAELAWSRLLRRRVEPLVNVGDTEINGIITRLKASKGQDQYLLSEIFLPATTENEAEVEALANRLLDQIRRGSSFVVFARQYSEAATAAVGGDRGWVPASQLDPALQSAVSPLTKGQVAGPIRAPGGFYLLLLNQKRKTLAADPLDATLTLKQIAITFPAGSTQDQAELVVKSLAAATKDASGCGRAAAIAQAVNGKVTDLPPAKIRDLPEGLHTQLEGMKIGQISEPFGTAKDARVLVLCGRDDPEETVPTFDEVYAQVNEQKVGLMARRYLRDLRRDAVVDYR